MVLTRQTKDTIEVPLCREVLWKATCFRNRMLLIFNSTLLVRVPSCPNTKSHLYIHAVHTIEYVSSHCDPRSVHHNLLAPDSRFVCSFLPVRAPEARSLGCHHDATCPEPGSSVGILHRARSRRIKGCPRMM